jgi:hypothetical protein
MAILISEYITRLKIAEQQILDGLVKISEEVALDFKALSVRNVQENGVGEYSKNKLPYFYFLGADKTKSNAGIKFIADVGKDPKKKKEGLTWAELRDAEGLQTDHVDLTFTGEMFRNLKILGTNVQKGGRVITLLGTDHPETINKLKWNAERYGDFLTISTSDRATIKSIIDKRVSQLIKKVLP